MSISYSIHPVKYELHAQWSGSISLEVLYSKWTFCDIQKPSSIALFYLLFSAHSNEYNSAAFENCTKLNDISCQGLYKNWQKS